LPDEFEDPELWERCGKLGGLRARVAFFAVLKVE